MVLGDGDGPYRQHPAKRTLLKMLSYHCATSASMTTKQKLFTEAEQRTCAILQMGTQHVIMASRLLRWTEVRLRHSVICRISRSTVNIHAGHFHASFFRVRLVGGHD